MTSHTTEKPALARPDNGSLKERQLRGEGVRTCLPAVVDASTTRSALPDAEWNIVRGED